MAGTPRRGSHGIDEILRLAARLSESGRAYTLATVVARQAPSSSRLGQKALVEADGTLHGWLGGSCIEPVVRKEAREALRDRRPRLIVLAPDARSDRADATVYPMTCHSGGTVEVYVEPQLPAPLLILYGDSEISRVLASIGARAGYRVHSREEPSGEERVPDLAGDAELYAVVATLGDWDEEAVESALRSGARYIGLVASPRRAAEVGLRLRERGWEKEGMSPLVSPAGLDIGAREPAEIAISVLAELIGRRRRPPETEETTESEAEEEAVRASRGETSGLAVDPVCGMEIRTDEARHIFEHEGAAYYFCCSSCRQKFERDVALAAET